MKPVLFIQYLRPSGRPVKVEIDRPDDIAALAERLQLLGYDLDAETLSTGTVSFTVTHPHTEECLAHQICFNGPAVPSVVDKLILAAAAEFDLRSKEAHARN